MHESCKQRHIRIDIPYLEKRTLRGRYSKLYIISAGSHFTLRACSQAKSTEAKDTNLFYEIRDIDLIAKEFKYHDFCYREFTRKVANANTKQFEDNDAER